MTENEKSILDVCKFYEIKNGNDIENIMEKFNYFVDFFERLDYLLGRQTKKETKDYISS